MHCDTDKVKKTNLSVDLAAIASDEGFKISDNPASGNCMFYALSEQLQSVKGICISQGELRRTLVRFLMVNSSLVSSTVVKIDTVVCYIHFLIHRTSKIPFSILSFLDVEFDVCVVLYPIFPIFPEQIRGNLPILQEAWLFRLCRQHGSTTRSTD